MEKLNIAKLKKETDILIEAKGEDKLNARFVNYNVISALCKGEFDEIAKYANPLTHEVY